THDYLVKNDVPHIYYIEPGVHEFKVWKNGLYMFSQLIFKPVDTATFSKYPVVGAPASTNVRGADYPQILGDHRVIFKIKAPEAQKVQIDLGKKYDMVKDTEGYWNVTTDSISEGFHYYSLIIDGVAVADPSSETFYGMGREASGIEIPFMGDRYYALANVPTETSASKIIIQLLPIHGGKCIYIHHRATMKISIKNILYYTFCVEVAKTKRVGPGKAKQI